MSGEPVYFSVLPITFSCPVPVNENGESMRDGAPIPLCERALTCGGKARFAVGAQIVCKRHLLETCQVMEIDADTLIADLGYSLEEIVGRPVRL